MSQIHYPIHHRNDHESIKEIGSEGRSFLDLSTTLEPYANGQSWKKLGHLLVTLNTASTASTASRLTKCTYASFSFSSKVFASTLVEI